MITNLYAIYDTKAKVYNTPFSQVNDSVAMRSVKDMANDPTTQCYKNPEDYLLFKIAKYDDEHAQIVTIPKPELLAKFIELKE